MIFLYCKELEIFEKFESRAEASTFIEQCNEHNALTKDYDALNFCAIEGKELKIKTLGEIR